MCETHSNTSSLVIIGNGMVTGRLLDELISLNHSFSITVISEEPFGSYNRILLSAVVSGDESIESIIQKNEQWYNDHRIRFLAGEKVLEINKSHQYVTTHKGSQIHYDQLIIATGSRSAKIPAQSKSLENIFTFRTIEDTQRILDCAQSADSVIIVGGGLLGLEAAYGLV